jgi:hypothetical protein
MGGTLVHFWLGYKLVLYLLKHVGTHATYFTNEVLGQLGRIDFYFPATYRAHEFVGFLGRGGLLSL